MRATFDDDKSKCGAEKKPKMKLKLCHFAVSTGKAINFGTAKGGRGRVEATKREAAYRRW